MKLKSVFIYILLISIATLYLVSCASTGSPSGGPRDKTPPELVEDKSAPNFEVNYTPEKIELEFNEFIELKSPNDEILISPPFFKRPKITSRGKKVTIEFPEEEPLRPDATYTINFGKSIVDFNESNPIEGFRFVFATGDKIDSLTFGGKIVDAYGGEPIKDVLVMMYDILNDSVVVSEKPFYYARTDDAGAFKFENLKNDTFKLLVLEDKNVNYLLDPELERLAFTDSLFILNDSSTYSPELRIFVPEQSTRILDSNSKMPGRITSIFNKSADKIEYSFLYPEAWDPITEKDGDTLKFWFSEPIDSAGIIFGVDTLDFTIKPFDSLFYSKSVFLKALNLASGKLAPFDSLMLDSNAPIARIDTSKISLSDKIILEEVKDSMSIDSLAIGMVSDSTAVDSLIKDSVSTVIDTLDGELQVDTTGMIVDSMSVENTLIDTFMIYDYTARIQNHKLQISTKWKEGHDYQLTLLPGAVTDIYGRSNDTLEIIFSTTSLNEYGNIALNAIELDSTLQYVVLLRDGDQTIRQAIVNNASNEVVNFLRLPINSYGVHLIEDINRDGKWTTGDYWKKRQPELLKEFELEKLRENWDLEANISWKGTVQVVTDSIGLDSLSVPEVLDVEKDKKQAPVKSNINHGRTKGSKGKFD